ncbi:PIN-like domain-containing protein [Pseudomonas syringae pv. actinidifoliorum]|nr:PIN-like domain-containing protein [Pseudomonas syringae pv. actinidifoliorum]MDU8523580.1 PIN-like domain-containing protein [Pseudomonas syringae pv. actinidifoliorum]MDU8525190.1 PIN-like domain-containing protein [Pseudomonas syringae pv. actinidifoliorum]
MKDLFKSFTSPSDEAIQAAWKSDQTIFVFDTNVFLNLYGFEQQTRKDFFATVQKVQGNIWIPFHVGLEFHNQRLNVISREKKIFQDLNDITERLLNKLKTDLAEHKLQTKFPKIQEHSEQLISSIETAISDFKTSIEPWDRRQPGVRSSDEVLEKIYQITEGRVGPPPPDQKWLDELYTDGEIRYERRIPPGFKDAGKDHINNTAPEFFHNGLSYLRKFGDLIIWKQTLQQAAASSVKNVFLITDDSKEDWWAIMKSSGSKLIGPHEALRGEIYSNSPVELFHMYSTSDFLSQAQKLLHVKVRESSINDASESQTRRIKKYHLELNPTLDYDLFKHVTFSQEDLARITKDYTSINKNIAEQWLTRTIHPASENIKESLVKLQLLQESITSTKVQKKLDHLQEINNKELEKVLLHNQILDSIRDNKHSYPPHVNFGEEEDDDDPV